jgi:hypothetical protein
MTTGGNNFIVRAIHTLANLVFGAESWLIAGSAAKDLNQTLNKSALKM